MRSFQKVLHVGISNNLLSDPQKYFRYLISDFREYFEKRFHSKDEQLQTFTYVGMNDMATKSFVNLLGSMFGQITYS